MGKRQHNGGNGGQSKKRKYQVTTGNVEPGQYGIYATCPKFKEKACLRELGLLFAEKLEEIYPEGANGGAGGEDDDEEEELSIEDAIKKEVAELKDTSKEAKKLKIITEMELGCECLVFLKCRRPIVPSEFVEKICKECMEKKTKSTRVTMRLSPIDQSCSASIEELKKMAAKVLKPHFHQEGEGQQKPYKFAIQVNRRNFSQVDKMDIIKTVAAAVGKEHGHTVDLKNYEKLILIECFKSSIGMSVVNNYDTYYKYNLQKIFEEQGKEEEKSEEEPEVVEQEK